MGLCCIYATERQSYLAAPPFVLYNIEQELFEGGFALAVYICKCGFCFERLGDAERCPDCASMNVRYATDKEAEEYRNNRAEADRAYAHEKQGKAFAQQG
jgi:hypothetical protein